MNKNRKRHGSNSICLSKEYEVFLCNVHYLKKCRHVSAFVYFCLFNEQGFCDMIKNILKQICINFFKANVILGCRLRFINLLAELHYKYNQVRQRDIHFPVGVFFDCAIIWYSFTYKMDCMIIWIFQYQLIMQFSCFVWNLFLQLMRMPCVNHHPPYNVVS